MHKGYKVCIALGLLMIMAALFLIGHNLVNGWMASKSVGGIFEELFQEISAQRPEQMPSLDGKEISPSDIEIPDYILNPNMDMPVCEIDGQEYIGTLQIPSLGLALPVINEWSYSRLQVAPCRYAGSVYLDNMVIAAHNYEAHFGNLKRLNLGDEILFTDMDGNVFEYEVVAVEILKPTAIEEMLDGEYALSLFTCTIGGQYRVTVRCDKLE